MGSMPQRKQWVGFFISSRSASVQNACQTCFEPTQPVNNHCAEVLTHLVKCMPSIVREGPYLGRPTALFDCVGPSRADKNVRAINLVYRAIAGGRHALPSSRW